MAKAVKGAFKWVAKLALGAAGFAIKPIVRALTPKAPEVDSSSSVNFRADPNAGVPYIIGQTGTAGVYTYATVGEAKNRNLLFYTILGGGGPIDSFVSFKMGDVSVVFDGPDTPESGPYRHLVWMRKQLGTAGAPALLPPNTLDAGVLAEWTSAHKTTGYAAAWYVLGADQTAYANGVPDPMWEIRGVKCYDWRLDSTYPGGSGPQRLADPTTWTFNENPAVHAVKWCLGAYQNGKRVLGLGASLAQIAMSKATEWANICDANGWKVGGVVYSTDTKWQVLKAICQAGGGYPTPLGTQVSFIFNAPRVSIATLTGADIEADPSIVGAQLRRDRFNRGVARYREKNNNWQIVPSAPLTVSEFVTQDGGITRTKEFEWPLVQNVDQAAQLLAYAMCNSRELGPLEFAVIPSWAGLDPGDCITINEPEFGLTSQKVVVTARSRSLDDFGRSLTCVTETDSKHPFCLGQSGTPPPLPSLTAVDTVPTPPDAGDWVVTRGYVDGPGGRLPAIIIDGECTDPNAIEIIFEYRIVGDTGEWGAVSRPVTAKHVEITGISPGSNYNVRVRYRYARNTEDPVSGNTNIGPILVSAISAPVPPDVLADIAAAQSAADAAQLDADAALTALFDPTTGALVEIDTLQTGQATHTSQIAVLQTADVTLAGRITTTEAKQQSIPNLLINGDASVSTAAQPLKGWLNSTAGVASAGYDRAIGSFWGLPANSSGSTTFFMSDSYPVYASEVLTVAMNGDAGGNVGATRPLFFLAWYNGTTFVSSPPGTTALDGTTLNWTDKRPSITATVPASGVTHFRVAIQIPNGALAFYVSRVMGNTGAVAVPFNDQATARDVAARVTTTEITSSSNTAAIAATDTRVGVSMQQGLYVNPNARFGSYTTSPGYPDGWSAWTGAASRFSRVNGEGANYAVRASPTAGETIGIVQTLYLSAGKYLLTFDGACSAGNWGGAGVNLAGVDSINCATSPDVAGVTGVGSTNLRRFSKIVTVSTAGNYNLHLMFGYPTFATVTAKTLDVYCCGIQSIDAAGQTAITASADATSALIAAATVDSALAAYESTANARLDGLDASVTTQGTAISNLQGRTASWLTKVAAAGADPAYIYMQSDATAAGGTDSYIALAAKSINLFNTVGGVLVQALALTGGNAYFPGSIYVGAASNVRIEGANKRIQVWDNPATDTYPAVEMGQLL